MQRTVLKQQQARNRRQGVAVVLIVTMMVVLIVSAALTVDVAYMQLIRTQLRSATDSATRSAVENLARTQDPDSAIAAAQELAAKNKIAGRSFQLDASDFTFGRTERSDSGRYVFQPDETPYTAVRINAMISDSSTMKSIPFFFAGALGHEGFSTSHSATASHMSAEVCISVDRSGSMMWDTSGIAWEYPPNNPELSTFTDWGDMWQNYLSPPHPTASRWAYLETAVNAFLEEADDALSPPRTALVSWGSEYTLPLSPYTYYPEVRTDVSLPSDSSHEWSKNRAEIVSALNAISDEAVCGSTALSSGLDRAVSVLTGTNSVSSAEKICILMSDGEWNEGRNPADAARDAHAAGVTVHTVTFLDGADQSTMKEIAEITGGQYFHASDEAELRAAFEELARMLPVTLTE